MPLALLLMLATPLPTVVSVEDPGDRAVREYRGIPLLAMLPSTSQGDAALVRCNDGFVVLLPLDVIRRYGPIVASEVHGEQGFAAIPSPQGPRYLVWPNRTNPEIDHDPEITTEGWAWGVDQVEVVQSSAYLAPLTPPGTDAGVQRGRALWIERCFHCHAVHGAGGIAGWDLSEPIALWRYRTPAEVARYLRDPRAVNPGGHMPPQPLTRQQLRDLFAFMHVVL
jgi:hypothetical protein